MRHSAKQQMSMQKSHPIFHVDYHSFLEKEAVHTNMELASEFGLSLREIKTLKQKLGRN